MVNPLVAQEESSTTAISGISLLEGAQDLRKAIESGDWASGALGAAAAGLDALGFVLDPFGSIFAAGVGWLIEHIGPLKDALDALAGNPDAVKAHSETWKNIANELGEVGVDLTNQVTADLTGWTGPSADTYRQQAKDVGDLLAAAKEASSGTASGIETAGTVVAAVRTLVRDIIAEVVGHMISWALQVIATLGIALAWVVPQVISEVAKTAAKIADVTGKLTHALKALSELLKKAGGIFTDTAGKLNKIKADKPPTPKKQNDLPAGPKSVDPMEGKGGGDIPDTKPKDPPKDSDQVAPPPKLNDTPGDTTRASSTPDVDKVAPPPKLDADPPANPPKPPPPADTPAVAPPPKLNDTTNASSAGGAAPKVPKVEEPPPLKDQGSNPRSLDDVVDCKDPIDVATGQMIMTETDFEFLGALPLVFQRSHFSSFRAGRALGTAWVSTVDQRVEVHEEGVSFAASDGTLQHFPHPEAGTWVASPAGPNRQLTRADDGGYLLGDRETDRLLYFAPGAGALPLTSESDRAGRRISYLRDDAGVPVEIRHSAGHRVRVESDGGLVTAMHSVAADGSEVELVRYGYTGARLTEVTNASGRPFRYDYDAAGRITGWTDRNGEWYRYHYDHAGRVVRTEGSGGFLAGTMEYDTENRITYSTDSLGHVTVYHLNENARVIRETDPLGHATVFSYDSADRLVSTTDALGRTTRREYDDEGNLITLSKPDGSVTTFERNALGLPVTMSEAPGVVTRWEYDATGELVRVTEPDGATTTYGHDGRGDVAAVTDALGNTLTVQSDAGGLPVAVTDPQGGVTRYERDRFGRVVAVTDPLGAVERFGYTVEGQLAWHRHADGALEQWIYDGEGNNRAHTDPVSGVTRAEVTHFDLPSAEIRPDGSRVEFAYDTERRLTAVTNEQGLVWRYSYDPAGNLVRETDFAGVTTTYAYDAADQMVERTDGSGQVTTRRYDAAGNVAEETTGGVTTRYTYSTLGWVLSADDGTSRIEFERDAAGRVLAETINGRTVRSAYDAQGRRVRRGTPSGAESVWEFDGSDQPVAVHAAGRSLRFAHDLAGREIRRELSAGAVITQSWLPGGQLAAQTVAGPGGQPSQQRSYSYRPDGLLTAVQDQLTGPRAFALDNRGRVTGVQSPRWTERYAYDLAGNLTEAVWPTTADADLVGPREVAGTAVTAAGQARYTHDAQGRVVLRERGGQVWQFLWDARGRLAGVRVPDGTSWRYSYDPLGRRTAKEHFAADGVQVLERVDFTWDGQLLVEQARSTSDGVRVTVWDYEPGTFRPLLQRDRVPLGGGQWADEQFHAVVTDPSGAPAELVTDQGAIAWFARTSVFGAVIERPATSVDTPLRFQGQYFDAETGLHYNFHRYYDPALGRYLSPDPLGLDAGPNHYAYVGNPHAFADPLGLAPTSCKKNNTTTQSTSTAGKRKRPNLTVQTQNLPSTPVTANSPGGSLYQQMSPGGKYGTQKTGKNGNPKFDKKTGKPQFYSRRDAAGYDNPSHDHSKMLPLWQDAAKSPIPIDPKTGKDIEGKQLKDWLMDKNRRFDTKEPGDPGYAGLPQNEIKGHGKGVLGHEPSASTHWNSHGGMQSTRQDNFEHNRETSTYHGIEERSRSDASGSSEEPYLSPRPDNGADRSFWDRGDPRFPDQGGPWHSWQKIQGPQPGPSGAGPGSPDSPLTAVPDTPPAKRPRVDNDGDVDMSG
ncbi:RHS repeat-associated core domain-containing protein [Amycolatopsis endophytica]|uniref:RHS repeat-associated protein n=1 Tax=Amycolatopsis endophytica TaxID=860233 RepID=A0A853BEM1_9PSEU|nr:RHS repeat-associated core domain-containing protein [Amycolatopsis endophytica]NYI93204.1 RHS repeat-associated protein [Amycolatopsis endophytica]